MEELGCWRGDGEWKEYVWLAQLYMILEESVSGVFSAMSYQVSALKKQR